MDKQVKEGYKLFSILFVILYRPTMIKYKISNIRDLIGHKVDLEMVNRNPICLLEKA